MSERTVSSLVILALLGLACWLEGLAPQAAARGAQAAATPGQTTAPNLEQQDVRS